MGRHLETAEFPAERSTLDRNPFLTFARECHQFRKAQEVLARAPLHSATLVSYLIPDKCSRLGIDQKEISTRIYDAANRCA